MAFPFTHVPAMAISGAIVIPMMEPKRVKAATLTGTVSGVYGMLWTKIEDPMVPTKNKARDWEKKGI